MNAPPDDLVRLPEDPPEGRRHQPDTAVWVLRDGTWRAGVVIASAGPAVTVRFRLGDGGGTGVDTITWPDVAADARTEPDVYLG